MIGKSIENRLLHLQFQRKLVESVKRILWQVLGLSLAVLREIKQTVSYLLVQLLLFLLYISVTSTSGYSPSRKIAQQVAASVYKIT